MPRVKLIHVGQGKWVEPTADIRTCKHPRDHLRFDGRFALPIYVYCTACGQPYLHPFHGLTEEEIAEHRGYVAEHYKGLFDDPEAYTTYED